MRCVECRLRRGGLDEKSQHTLMNIRALKHSGTTLELRSFSAIMTGCTTSIGFDVNHVCSAVESMFSWPRRQALLKEDLESLQPHYHNYTDGCTSVSTATEICQPFKKGELKGCAYVLLFMSLFVHASVLCVCGKYLISKLKSPGGKLLEN